MRPHEESPEPVGSRSPGSESKAGEAAVLLQGTTRYLTRGKASDSAASARQEGAGGPAGALSRLCQRPHWPLIPAHERQRCETARGKQRRVK